MVEQIHVTRLEAIGHILKQLRQVAILKSALNDDETAMNKRLKFGFFGSAWKLLLELSSLKAMVEFKIY